MSRGDPGSHRGVCGGRGGDARREIQGASGGRTMAHGVDAYTHRAYRVVGIYIQY
jgi:hypothetical protein